MFDLSARIKNRVQISSDSLSSYAVAVERGFGSGVDYGQIVKTYASDERCPQGKYSAPEVVEKSVIMPMSRGGNMSQAGRLGWGAVIFGALIGVWAG
jgi:hypothetical protein